MPDNFLAKGQQLYNYDNKYNTIPNNNNTNTPMDSLLFTIVVHLVTTEGRERRTETRKTRNFPFVTLKGTIWQFV